MRTIRVGSIDETGITGSIDWKITDFLTNVKKEKIDYIRSPNFRVSGEDWRVYFETICSREERRNPRVLIRRSQGGKFLRWIARIRKPDGVMVGATTGISTRTWLHLFLNIQALDVRKLAQCGVLTISLVWRCLFKMRSQWTQTSERCAAGEVLPPPWEPSGLNKLSRDFEDLLESRVSSDATILVHGEKFPVHTSILSARTPVFAAMFRHDTLEKASGVVQIDDCEPDTFRQFLLYVYSGKVGDLTPEIASALYEIADKYEVLELKEECLQRVKSGLSVQSFCHVIGLALRHGEMELIATAFKFFKEHLKEIILTVEWQNFMGENHITANELLIKALGAAKK